MSDNATLVKRLLNNRAPAIFEAAREAVAHIVWLEARIAELEGELDRMKTGQVFAQSPLERIAELEAELSDFRLRYERPRTWAENRIAELEADANLFVYLHALAIEHGHKPDPGESAYDFLQRIIIRARSPEIVNDLLDSASRIAELEAKVAAYEADLEDPTLSVGEAYADRSKPTPPRKKPRPGPPLWLLK